MPASLEDMQEARHIAVVGGDGILNASGNTTYCGLMKHIVNTGTCFLAFGYVTDVSMHEAEVSPLLKGNVTLYFIKIAPLASGKIV
jgi:hypothetical protein